MAFENLKIAAYLDEAGDNPIDACKTIISHDINYVVIRSAWNNPIDSINDQECSHLRKILADHNLSPVAIVSKLGVDKENSTVDKIERMFNLASFFQVNMVRVSCGSKMQDAQVVQDWVQLVTEKAVLYQISPLYEPIYGSYYYNSVDVAKFIVANKKWRLLYDPVQLIIKQNQDPFTKYWTLLKSHVSAVDLRDFKIGYGFKPLGYGDSKANLVIGEALSKIYTNWFFLEPSLGRKYGPSNTRSETFNLYVDSLHAAISAQNRR